MMLMMTNSSIDAEAVFLPDWFMPSDRDVICGWARQNHRHAGNQRFRNLVEHSAPLYVSAKTKLEKTQVIASVVDKVRRDSPGGGFVKRDFHTGLWFEIGDDKARDKVGHAIRRAIDESKKRKSKAKSKLAKGTKKQKIPASDDKSDDSSATTYLTKMPHASLDDFEDDKNDRRLEVMKRVKGMDVQGEEEKISTNMLASQMFQEKSDSLVVPSFLYQQGPGLAGFHHDHAFGPGSQAARALDQNTGPPASNNILIQNNQPLFDVLTNQGQGVGLADEGFLPGISQMTNQLSQQTDAKGKLSKIHSSSLGNTMNQTMSNFFAMPNRQGLDMATSSSAFHLDHFSQLSNNPTPQSLELLRTGQANSLPGFMQMSADAQFGLPYLAGNNQTFGVNPSLSFDPLLGSRGGMLPMPMHASSGRITQSDNNSGTDEGADRGAL